MSVRLKSTNPNGVRVDLEGVRVYSVRMALNIKNQRVVELAKQCAQLTGQTQVTVVEAALEAYLASVITEEPTHRARGEQLVREVQAEAQTTGALSTDELYDKDGLPA